LIDRAQNQGHHVYSLKADINDVSSLEYEILECSPDAVIHCAGISFVASKDEEAFYRVHALGTSNLLKALLRLPKIPSKVLLASSATVYGNCMTIPTPEDQPVNPVDHYAMSKVAMEEMAKTFFNKLPIVIARPFNYTGPGQKESFLIPKLIKHFVNRSPIIALGNINVQREFNDVISICRLYLALLDFGLPGEIYNVGSGQARSLLSVIQILKNITGHHLEIESKADLIRPNEIVCMQCNPQKIMALMESHGLSITFPQLEDTLRKMLDISLGKKSAIN
jgi:nucleoside-diphosphate-sugar epimerase